MAASKSSGPQCLVVNTDGVLYEDASLDRVIAKVLPDASLDSILVLVDFKPSKPGTEIEGRSKDLALSWGVYGSAKVALDGGKKKVLEFSKTGDTAYLMWMDGITRLLIRQGEQVQQIVLDVTQATAVRIEHVEECLAKCRDDNDKDIRRRDGLLFSMIHYLETLRFYPKERKSMLDFFRKYELSQFMRGGIRNVLEKFNDSAAKEFADTGFKTEKRSGAKKPEPKAKRQKKEARKQRDRKNRLEARGRSEG